MNTKSTLKIELTPEQQEQVRQVTSKAVAAINLLPEELEERIAPAGYSATRAAIQANFKG